MEKQEKLTITLTDHRPIKINKSQWPIIAESADTEFDNQYEFQANRISKWALRVRQHEDGRAIVYAVYSYDSNWQNSRSYQVRGGALLDSGDDLPAAIRRVGEWASQQEHCGEDADRWEALIRECIADLPAEEI